jgi:hypothetical protein
MAEAINRGRLSFDIQSNGKIYEQQPGRQVGDDNYHVDLYGEIVAELRANAPETLTDSNTIFLDGINGNDSTGDGSESTPYKTVAKGVEVFFAQGTRTLKYFCLKGYSYFCEDVQIPRWLEDYIYCESSTATAIGNVDLSGGHDWSAGNEELQVYLGITTTIILNANCANVAAIVSHINTLLASEGITELEAYAFDTNYIGIRYTNSGDEYFGLNEGDARETLGLVPGIYVGKTNISIRRVSRIIPSGLNNINTKWMEVWNNYEDSGSDGTQLKPWYAFYDFIQTDLTTSAFENIAIRVYDDFYYMDLEQLTFVWLPDSAITQTVNIFPYYTNTGYDIQAGFSIKDYLYFGPPSSFRKLSVFSGYPKYQYIISRNFSTNGEEEIIYSNFGTNTYAIEKTYNEIATDVDVIASTSTKNWTGICEYYYNGYWYLLVCADDGGSAMRIFHYRSDGSDTGEITISLDNTASTTKRHYFMSDGNNAFMVCYDSSKSYIFLAKDNVDITVNSNWLHIYEGTGDIRLFKTGEGEFYWLEDGKTNLYEYDGNGSYYSYNFNIYITSVFKYNNEIYLTRENIETIIEVYKYISDTNTIVFYSNLLAYTIHTSDIDFICYYKNTVYLMSQSDLFSFNENGIKEIDGFGTMNFASYQLDVYKGMIVNVNDSSNADFAVLSSIASIMTTAKIKISGFEFITDAIPTTNTNSFGGIGVIGDNITCEYCSFYNFDYGIVNKQEMLDNISNCAFIDCDYPVVIEGYADYDVENCSFSNYITGVHYQCLSDANTEPLTINNCTGYSGTTFFEEDDRDVNTDQQSSVNDCIISKTSVSIKSYADTAVDVTNSILYPYSTSLNATFNDDCTNAIPLFQDPEDNDFRLKTISAGYQYNSAGYQEIGTTDTATGKDYSWTSYSAQNIDLGAMVVLDPVFRGEQWETITLDYSPQSFQLDYIQDDTSLNRTLQNKAYKVSPKIYRQFTYSFRSDNSFNLDNIQKIRRLMEQTDKFKLFMNPLLDYDPSECADGTVGWRSGNWTITDMVIATGFTMETGMYNNLFVRIHDSGDIYEYRISDTDSSGNLTLEDYWEIGDMTNGTYNTEISYALVLYDTSNLQNKNQVYGGINYNDSVPLAGQTLKFIEAI